MTTVLGRWRRKDQVFKITPTQLSSEFQVRFRKALSEKEGREEKQKEVSRRSKKRQKGEEEEVITTLQTSKLPRR